MDKLLAKESNNLRAFAQKGRIYLCLGEGSKTKRSSYYPKKSFQAAIRFTNTAITQSPKESANLLNCSDIYKTIGNPAATHREYIHCCQIMLSQRDDKLLAVIDK